MSEPEAIIPEIQTEALSFKMPIIEALKIAALKYQETAEALKIENNDDFLNAGALRDSGMKFYKIYLALLNPACQDLDALHSKAVERRDAVCKPYEAGSKAAKQKIMNYEEEAKRKRQIEQAKIDAENNRKAEEDKLALAEELKKAGLKEEAEEALERPTEVQQTILPPATPKISGFRYRTIWDFEVIDLNLVPEEYKYVCVDEKKIKAVVGRLKAATNIPGIKVVERKV